MSYKDLCIELLTNPGSPFKGHIWNNLSFGGMFYDCINMIAYIIANLFKIVLDGMNSFAIGAYRFMSFSESSTVSGLYNLLSKYIWIPVLLCGLIMCFRIVMGDIIKKNVGKQFVRNLCYLFVAVAILPSVFNYINHDVFGGYQYNEYDNEYEDTTLFSHTMVNNNDDNTNGKSEVKISLANEILRNNATDKLWLYDYLVKSGSIPSDLDETITTMRNQSNSTTSVMGAGTLQITSSMVDLYYGDMQKASSINDIDSFISNIKSPDVRKKWLASDAVKDLSFENGAETINEKLTEYVHNDWNEASSGSNESNGSDIHFASEGSVSGGGGGDIEDFTRNYTEGVPNLLKLKAVNSYAIGERYILQPLSDGTNLLGITGATYLGKDSYWRYNIDWISVYVEMLAYAYVFFVVGYCAVKLIIELIVHQVFGGIMAAMDLSGGDRIKKYFTAIIGCYMGLLIGIMVIPLYQAGCNFITNDMGIDSGFIRALLKIVLAMVIVNVPNIISMYFGINTGARGGAVAALAGAGIAMRVGRTAGRTVKNTVGGAMHTAEKWQGIGHRRGREHLQDARFESGRQERRDQAQHAQEREQLADQRYATKQAQHSEQAQQAQERGTLEDQRNERSDFSNNRSYGMRAASDMGRGIDVTPDEKTARKLESDYSKIAQEAEKNGGSREAYMQAAEQEMMRQGALKPTPETRDYVATASKEHHEQAKTNARATEIYSSGNGTVTLQQARVQAAKESLSGWGASDQHLETAVTYRTKAEQLPKRNDNDSLKKEESIKKT